MRKILAKKIENMVAELCILANLNLRNDVLATLKVARLKEKHNQAKSLISVIIQNALIAKKEKRAICQDTGMPCIFVEIGQKAYIEGDLKAAINKGVAVGYKKGFLRNSIIKDPLSRKSPQYLPPVIHIDIVKGSSIKLTVLPKGFGCENKAQLKMFKPTAKMSEIQDFVVEAVRTAGPDACPPYIVGVGIGGTADYAALLAKKALLQRVESRKPKTKNQKFANDILQAINKLNIGPMGLGGKTTALAVNIETYPTHIAGLPVAVNISCHALRSATALV